MSSKSSFCEGSIRPPRDRFDQAHFAFRQAFLGRHNAAEEHIYRLERGLVHSIVKRGVAIARERHLIVPEESRPRRRFTAHIRCSAYDDDSIRQLAGGQSDCLFREETIAFISVGDSIPPPRNRGRVVLGAIKRYLRFASTDPVSVVVSAGIWVSLVLHFVMTKTCVNTSGTCCGNTVPFGRMLSATQ
jgi:hypothetical protein